MSLECAMMLSPYLTQPSGGTWRKLREHGWLHEETGSIWPVPPSDLVEFGFIKTIEQAEEESRTIIKEGLIG